MKLRLVLLVAVLLSAPSAFAQGTFFPVTLAFPQIAVGGDPAGQNYVTILQMVNNNSASTTGHFELLSDAGSALPALFDGQGPQSSIDVALAPGEFRQIEITLSGDVTPGWLAAVYAPVEAVTAVILQFRSGGKLLSEVGVAPSFSPILSTDFAGETDASLNTGIAVANPSNAPLYILARLWDSSSGEVLGNTLIQLPGNGHIARFVTEVFPNIENIGQTRVKISLDSCSSPACVSVGGNGFLATAIRLNRDQFTTIPVTARTTTGEAVRILPQVAFGGPANGLNMKTALYLTTNVATGVFGTADVFDDAGNPLAVSVDGAAPAASFPFTVPGNRVSRVVLSGDQVLRSGWIRLTLSSSAHLIANAVFQTFLGADVSAEASVLDTAPVKHGLIQVRLQQGTNIGVALANSQPDSNAITFEVFDREGFLTTARDITLPANGHKAQFVTEIFPELAAFAIFDGSLSIRSATAFESIALRLTGDKLAALPIAENGMHRPSITALRITSTQRSPARVNFSADVTDLDSNLATDSSSTISADAFLDFGNAGSGSGPISLDGTAVLNRTTGTISGSFQPPNVTGTVPSGTLAAFYLQVYDVQRNISNVIALQFRF